MARKGNTFKLMERKCKSYKVKATGGLNVKVLL